MGRCGKRQPIAQEELVSDLYLPLLALRNDHNVWMINEVALVIMTSLPLRRQLNLTSMRVPSIEEAAKKFHWAFPIVWSHRAQTLAQECERLRVEVFWLGFSIVG